MIRDHEFVSAHYSRALDEIYWLRVALAYERKLGASMLGYQTLPKKVRSQIANQVDRLERTLHNGPNEYRVLYGSIHKALLREAGARETLTVHAWEHGEVDGL